MENNKKASNGQKTIHINIRYFSIKDRTDKGEVTIIYYLTYDMIADLFTTLLQDIKCLASRKLIMRVICKDGKESGDIGE